MSKLKKPRWQWERRLGCFSLDAAEHINSQCIAFSITLNWNHRPSVEVDFLFWCFSVEYAPKPA